MQHFWPTKKALEMLQWFTFMCTHTVWYNSIYNFHLLRHFCCCCFFLCLLDPLKTSRIINSSDLVKAINWMKTKKILSMFYLCYLGACSSISWNILHTFSKTLFTPHFHFLYPYQSELFYHNYFHEQEHYLTYVKEYFVMACFDVFEFSFLYQIYLKTDLWLL